MCTGTPQATVQQAEREPARPVLQPVVAVIKAEQQEAERSSPPLPQQQRQAVKRSRVKRSKVKAPRRK